MQKEKAKRIPSLTGATRLSVIVPVFNEVAALPELVRTLAAVDSEIFIVDGNSQDGSWAWLNANWADDERRVALRCTASRSGQMNMGAQHASGDVLLFLHADTVLPQGFEKQLARFSESDHEWGRFNLCFTNHQVRMALVAWMINQRSRISGIATGDQAIFVKSSAFERVGGYPLIPLMEDVEISRRLKKLSKPLCLQSTVLTSARRWEQHGWLRTVLVMWALRLAYFLGVPADRLAAYYAGSPE